MDTAGRSASTQECGFEDINGDGLADRVKNFHRRHCKTRDGRFDRAVFQRIIRLPGPPAFGIPIGHR